MSKEKSRGNREAKKPKKPVAKPSATAGMKKPEPVVTQRKN